MYESKRDSGWQATAYQFARKLLRKRAGSFLAEELLPDVIAKAGEPADRRSFGGVIRRLHDERVIKPAGYGRARSSHGSAKPRWKVAA